MKTYKMIFLAIALLECSTVSAQWVQTNSPYGGKINCLAVNGTNLFATTAGGGVFRTADNGTSWTDVNNSQIDTNISSLIASAGNLYIATYDSGVFRYSNIGATWQAINNGLNDRNITSFAINGSTFFAGSSRSGYNTWPFTRGQLYQSYNGGENWQMIDTNFGEMVIRNFAFSGSYIFAGANAGDGGGAVFRSADNGISWDIVFSGFIYASSTSLLIHGTTIFEGMDGLHGRLVRSMDNGTTWSEVNIGSTTNEVISLTASGPYLFAGTNYGIYVSANDGDSWTPVGLENSNVNTLAVCGIYIFAGTDNGIWRRPLSDFMTDIIPVGSTVEKLSTNQFVFTEGPVWYNDSIVLFTDDGLGSPDIFQYNPVENEFSSWPTNASHCLGLACDKEGNLIGSSSNILMMNKTGQVYKTLTSGYNGKPFDNPNDLIADNKGGIYFTDPDYFLTNPPQDKTAVYYIDPTGNVIRVIDDLVKPNGLVLSPDGTKLYVVDAGTIYVYSWDVASDGSVSGKSTFAQLQTNNGVAGGDGMAIDINGNIYVATELGIQIFSAQGAAITTIVLPEMPSNCDFGGKDFKTLYITARTNLYSIELNYPGFAVSRGSNPNRVNSISYQPLDKLYPNPVKDKFTIELTVLKEKAQLSIFNTNGQQVMEQQITDIETEVDVSNLPTGLYFLRLKNGNSVETGKIVKE